jgi:hypothetical protein
LGTNICILPGADDAVSKDGLAAIRMVAHACNPSTQETEVRGSYVQGQPGLQSKVETSLSSIEKHFFLKKKNALASNLCSTIHLLPQFPQL